MIETILFILTVVIAILTASLCFILKSIFSLIKDIKMLDKSLDIKDYTLAKSIEKDLEEPSPEVIEAIEKMNDIEERPVTDFTNFRK